MADNINVNMGEFTKTLQQKDPALFGSSTLVNPQVQTDAPKEKKITQVTSAPANVKEKTIAKKVTETVFKTDGKTIGRYLWFDVIDPFIRNTILSTLSMALLGTSNTPSSSSLGSGLRANSNGAYFAYNSVGKKKQSAVGPAVSSQPSRADNKFDGTIIFSSSDFQNPQEEARKVVIALQDVADEYSFATVSDLYAAVGKTADWAALKWGWTKEEISGARTTPLAGDPRGVILVMPPVTHL